mgnify:CR=1 FL=1
MQAQRVPAVSTRIAGLVDLFRSPSKPDTNNSIPTNSSVASLLIVSASYRKTTRKRTDAALDTVSRVDGAVTLGL